MSWWINDNTFDADINDYGELTGFITFPSSVMIEPKVDGEFMYVDGTDILKWARENGKPFYKRILAFKRIDLPMEVDVLSADYLVDKNVGKIYKWNDKLWELQKNEYGAILFQDFIKTPTEMFLVDEDTKSGGYDITNYATLIVQH